MDGAVIQDVQFLKGCCSGADAWKTSSFLWNWGSGDRRKWWQWHSRLSCLYLFLLSKLKSTVLAGGAMQDWAVPYPLLVESHLVRRTIKKMVFLADGLASQQGLQTSLGTFSLWLVRRWYCLWQCRKIGWNKMKRFPWWSLHIAVNFHLAVSWVVLLPPEEESSAPPALLVPTGAKGRLAGPEWSQWLGRLCGGLVNYPKEVRLPRQPAGALETILLSGLNCK